MNTKQTTNAPQPAEGSEKGLWRRIADIPHSRNTERGRLFRAARKAGSWVEAHAKWPQGGQAGREESKDQQPSQPQTAATPPQPQQSETPVSEMAVQGEQPRAETAVSAEPSRDERQASQAAETETQPPGEPAEPQALEPEVHAQPEPAEPQAPEPEVHAQPEPSQQEPSATETQSREVSTSQQPQRLFDGTDESFRCWKLVGAGKLERSDGELHIIAGDDCGLAYYTGHGFDDFRLRLQYRPNSSEVATTAVVHFLDPEQPVPDRDDPSIQYSYENRAYVAPHTGFEVQLSSAQPGDDPGTFEGVLLGDAGGAQLHDERADVKPGDWNELEVEVAGSCHVARLNGKQTASFANPDSYRGKPASAAPHAGFIGLLIRKGEVWLRNIEVEVRAGRGTEAGASHQSSAQATH